MRFTLITFATTLAFLATATAARAQDIQERTIKFGHLNNTDHPTSTGVKKFAELVAAKSGGKIKVQEYPSSQLGNELQQQSALVGGVQEMLVASTTSLAGVVKEFGLLDFPFLFSNARQADAMVDGPLGKALSARLADKGIIGLGYWELGFRNLSNSRRAINTVDDIAGLKLRVIPNAINVDWVKALGANPTPMAFPEVYAGLESKAIDGQENPLSVIQANKFFEVQKYLTLTNHQYNPQSVLISKKFWDTLSAAEKKILEEATLESAKFQREQARGQVAAAIDNMKKNGMQVNELSPAELGKFVEKMKPVISKHAQTIGAETVNELLAELAKARR